MSHVTVLHLRLQRVAAASAAWTGTVARVDPGGADDRTVRERIAAVEIAVGAVLVVLVALGGAYFAWRPGSGTVDGWFFDLFPSTKNGVFTSVTALRQPWFVIAGSVVACRGHRHPRPAPRPRLSRRPTGRARGRRARRQATRGSDARGDALVPVRVDGRRGSPRVRGGARDPSGLEAGLAGGRVAVRALDDLRGRGDRLALPDRCLRRSRTRGRHRAPRRRARPADGRRAGRFQGHRRRSARVRADPLGFCSGLVGRR